MIVCGLMGMSLKFVECTLGVHYRDVDDDGVVYGGPMYYLTKGLKEKGFVTVGKIAAVFFAIFLHWWIFWWWKCCSSKPSCISY